MLSKDTVNFSKMNFFSFENQLACNRIDPFRKLYCIHIFKDLRKNNKAKSNKICSDEILQRLLTEKLCLETKTFECWITKIFLIFHHRSNESEYDGIRKRLYFFLSFFDCVTLFYIPQSIQPIIFFRFRFNDSIIALS